MIAMQSSGYWFTIYPFVLGYFFGVGTGLVIAALVRLAFKLVRGRYHPVI